MARTFNDLDEDGRKTSVLLHLQHAFEMLLKAGLVQHGVAVFDKRMGRSIGFEACVNRAREHLNVTEEEAGLLKAVDALRDEAQHWLTDVPEAILYSHCRGAITLYDRLLQQTFQQRLADSLPSRVLPLSTEPPRDIQLLIDEQYSQVQALLQPGKRRGAEARAGIRTLLALEAHVAQEPDEGPRVSEKDVDRVEAAIRTGQTRGQVFPQLGSLGTEVTGDGLEVKVRFVKSGGMPVTYVDADSDVDAAAVREFDLQRRYHWQLTPLAKKLGINTEASKAIRWKLGLEGDPTYHHVFKFGRTEHHQFNDNALRAMQDFIRDQDVDAVLAEYRQHRRR